MALLEQLPRDVLLNNIGQGFVLLVLGMGTVFLFLLILIFVTKLMSSIVRKFAPAKTVVKPLPQQQAPAAVQTVPDEAEIAAAIVAAVAKSKE